MSRRGSRLPKESTCADSTKCIRPWRGNSSTSGAHFGPLARENDLSAPITRARRAAACAPDRRLSQAIGVIALYFRDFCGVDMSTP